MNLRTTCGLLGLAALLAAGLFSMRRTAPPPATAEILEPSAGAMDRVTEAILNGRPVPKGLEPDVPDPAGDDAEACREAKRGNFERARERASSRAMKALLDERKLPAACPDFIPQLEPSLR